VDECKPLNGGAEGGGAPDAEALAAISDRMKAEEADRAAASAADPNGPEGKMTFVREKLPIMAIREGLVEALKDSPVVVVSGRVLHSSTFQLNLSRF